jgi:hypothetical protein
MPTIQDSIITRDIISVITCSSINLLGQDPNSFIFIPNNPWHQHIPTCFFLCLFLSPVLRKSHMQDILRPNLTCLPTWQVSKRKG